MVRNSVASSFFRNINIPHPFPSFLDAILSPSLAYAIHNYPDVRIVRYLKGGYYITWREPDFTSEIGVFLTQQEAEAWLAWAKLKLQEYL